MNKKISNRVNKILSFKKIVSIGFFAAFMAVFLSVGIVKAETTYKWVNNGSAAKSDSRKTGDCSTKKQVTTYTCSSSTKGNKLYDGTNKGSSYGDIGNAWPIYEGENTSTATEYTFDGCVQDVHKTSGTVNEWECKSSDSTSSNSSSSSSNSNSSASSVSKPTVTTGSATNITSNSATISATINNGGASSAQSGIYYMKSNGSSWTLAVNKTLSGSGDQDISADITGLSSGTKYYYQAKAQNSAGVKNGSQKTFTTSSGSSVSSSSSSVQQYTLKAKISGAGKITSSSGSGVINCKKSVDSKGKSETSGDCNVKFNKGESVTLTVSTPSTKYEFATWADACRGSQQLSSCTIVMNGDKTVSATFNKKVGSSEDTVTVSIRKTGKGVGKVVSIGLGKNAGKVIGGINCGSNCSESYPLNSEGYIYLKATPEKGSTFGGWGEGCSSYGTKDTCTVTLGGDKTLVAAHFDEKKSKSKSSSSKSSKSSSSSVSSSSSSQSATIKIKNIGTGRGYTYVYSYQDGKNTSVKTCSLNSGSTCEVEQSSGVTLRIQAKPYQSSFDSWESGCESTQKASVSGDLCNLTVGRFGNTVNVRFTKSSNSSNSSSSSSSTSSSVSGSASVDLKAREVKTGSAFGDYSDSLTLNNANSGGNESIDLKWTVSGVSSCSLSYDSNAKHLKSSVSSSDLIVSSGDTRYNTEDYVVNSSSRQTATYTLTCKDSSGNSKSDSVSVTY